MRISSGDVVCDIGANKGSYLYWMSRWAGRVAAFEPQPQLAEYIRSAAHRLRLDNIVIEAAAVSDRSGHCDLYVPSPGSPEASIAPIAGAETLRVPMVSLDDYFNDGSRVALLKVDVEGAELDVFKGAERILRQHRPVLLFECEQRHLRTGTVYDCFSYLEARGYRGAFVQGRTLKPVSEFDLALHQSQKGERFWRDPDYCNNFLFEPNQG
ncbi:FkbM family methyltransferase [Brevundimonas sp.]|uniref:FkbM family methyltransferase n=1 Tax=Brevundimonas sp. TaxID=1871086 RepID=UPI003566C833